MGSELESRHNERITLHLLYRVKNGINIDDAISEFEARMEEEDINFVKRKIEDRGKQKSNT